MNRSEVSRLIAKVLAYAACGKLELASQYARQLTTLLRAHGIDC